MPQGSRGPDLLQGCPTEGHRGRGRGRARVLAVLAAWDEEWAAAMVGVALPGLPDNLGSMLALALAEALVLLAPVPMLATALALVRILEMVIQVVLPEVLMRVLALVVVLSGLLGSPVQLAIRGGPLGGEGTASEAVEGAGGGAPLCTMSVVGSSGEGRTRR